MNHTPSEKKSTLLPLLIVIVFSCAVITTTAYSFILKIPFLNIIHKFFNDGYILHYNYIIGPKVSVLHFHFYLYVIFVTSLMTLMLFLCVYRLLYPKKNTLHIPNAPFVIACIVFVIATANQSYTFLRYYKTEKDLCGGLSLHERNLRLSGDSIYEYATLCKMNISGHQNAQLITDFDLSAEPGMTHHRMLGYYLYPIDIRGVRNKEPDYLLYFMKKDAINSIPENFKVRLHINESNLIAERVK